MSQNNRDPQTYTAERALLYALLTDAAFVPEIRDLLSVEDFYAGADGLRGRIYRTILEAWEAGRPHDTLTLTDHFYAAGQARAAEEVGNLDSTAPFTLNPAYYAREIRDRATRRKLLRMGQRFGELARDPNADTVESLGKAEQYLREIQVGSAVGGWSDPSADAAALLDDLDARQRRYHDGAPQGLETGIGPLSALTGPLEGGWLVVVAAAPSVGKTALALQIADHVASQGTPAGFISLEMPRAQLQLRRVAGRAQIPHHILKRGSFNLAERQSLTAAAEEMSALPLLILDDCHTADGICASLRVLKARHPEVGLVVVDYLQLI
jgi:replicative DNA helicase